MDEGEGASRDVVRSRSTSPVRATAAAFPRVQVGPSAFVDMNRTPLEIMTMLNGMQPNADRWTIGGRAIIPASALIDEFTVRKDFPLHELFADPRFAGYLICLAAASQNIPGRRILEDSRVNENFNVNYMQSDVVPPPSRFVSGTFVPTGFVGYTPGATSSTDLSFEKIFRFWDLISSKYSR